MQCQKISLDAWQITAITNKGRGVHGFSGRLMISGNSSATTTPNHQEMVVKFND